MSPDELALTEVSAPFWTAAARGELTLQCCDECRRFVWYPRAICPACGSTALTWTPASGTGSVYALSVHHKPARPELGSLTPYAILLVDLDEGVRMMARASGAPPDTFTVGTRVRWQPDPDGGRAFLFVPV